MIHTNSRKISRLHQERIRENNLAIVRKAMLLKEMEKPSRFSYNLRHYDDMLVDSILLKEELLLEFNTGYVKDIVQFVIGGAAEYGIDIATLGAGAPIGSAAETVIDGLFALDSVTSAYQTIKEVISGGFEPFKMILDKVMKLKDSWAGGAENFLDQVKSIIGEVLGKFKKAGESVQKIVDKIKEFVEKPIQKLVDAIVEGVKAIIPDATVGTGIATALRATADSNMGSIFNTMLDKFMELAGSFKEWLTEPGKASGWIKELGNKLVEAMKAMISDNSKKAGNKTESLLRRRALEEGFIDDIKSGAEKLGGFVKDSAKVVGDKMLEPLKKGWELVKKFGNEALEKVMKFIEEGIPKLAKMADDLVETVVPGFFGVLGIAQALFTGDYSSKSGEAEGGSSETPDESAAVSKLEKLPPDEKKEIISKINTA